MIQNKLNFVHHLVSQRDQEESESLAGEVFNLQAKYGFPGLVTECRKYIQTYKLPNIIDDKLNLSKLQWKNCIKDGMKDNSAKIYQKRICKVLQIDEQKS